MKQQIIAEENASILVEIKARENALAYGIAAMKVEKEVMRATIPAMKTYHEQIVEEVGMPHCGVIPDVPSVLDLCRCFKLNDPFQSR